MLKLRDSSRQCLLSFFVVSLLTSNISSSVEAVQFTFALADGAENCFYEEIKRNTTAYLEFQVSAGGQLGVDVVLKDHHGRIMYEQQKATFHTHQFDCEATGIYQACFSNKFSTFSHKTVYVNFQVGERPALPSAVHHATTITHMKTSSQVIHKSLNNILDAQTHHRLREAPGHKQAKELNERVMWWTCVETIAILIISIGQIIVLRNFFAD